MTRASLNGLSPSRNWATILDHAAALVRSYDTQVTLRQLFYRLVSDATLRNTNADYVQLSSRTAKARRDDAFPDLLDRKAVIHRYRTFASVQTSMDWLRKIYRRDRTEGQPYTIILGLEKAGLIEQFLDWFGDLGIPIIAFSGYCSTGLHAMIRDEVARYDRPAVFLYGGDFDPRRAR